MTETRTADALAAAEDLQAFVDRIAYVRCHMAAGDQATFDKLTGYPYTSERKAPPLPCGVVDASGRLICEEPAEHQGQHREGAVRWAAYGEAT